MDCCVGTRSVLRFRVSVSRKEHGVKVIANHPVGFTAWFTAQWDAGFGNRNRANGPEVHFRQRPVVGDVHPGAVFTFSMRKS